MVKRNKVSVRLFDGIVDEWKENYSHAEFSDDGHGFMVYKSDDEERMMAWYNTDYATSIIVTEYECEK